MSVYNVDFQDDVGNSYQVMANPNSKAEFSQASSRSNIASGETHKTIFGKLMKWLADFGTAAFCAVANNDTTTAAGYVADARIVRTHGLEIDQLSSDLGKVNIYVGSDGKLHFTNSAGADTVLPFKKLDSLQCIASATGYDYSCILPSGHTEIILIVSKYHASAGINTVAISGTNSLIELCSTDNNNDGTGGNGCIIIYYATCNSGATISAHTGEPGEVRRSSMTVLAL